MLAILGIPAVAHAQLVPEVSVQIAPPAPRVEVMGVAPSPRHSWVPGYWAWRGGAHVWVTGHWMVPPHNGMVWEPAHWDRRGGGWGFREGHWRWGGVVTPTTVYEPQPAVYENVAVAPPEPIVEVRPATPFGGAVWIPGYWGWNGAHHVWIGGRYSAPRAGFVWEANRWERGPGGWRHVQGHWRHL
jgi:hypothetical protein